MVVLGASLYSANLRFDENPRVIRHLLPFASSDCINQTSLDFLCKAPFKDFLLTCPLMADFRKNLLKAPISSNSNIESHCFHIRLEIISLNSTSYISLSLVSQNTPLSTQF